MGSYLSTSKFFELPFIKKKNNNSETELFLTNKMNDNEIIEAIINSNINHIQTINQPTDKELIILNEIFKRRPDIAFRHYDSCQYKFIDIGYLKKLNNLKSLSLDLHVKVININILKELNLESLSLSCFSLKDYSFLKDVNSSIKSLTIDLEDKSYKMDINDIIHMKELESISLRNVKKGLDKLIEFKNLKELYLRSITIKDYKFLNEMNVNKIYLSFQNPEYFNTFGTNEKIEEVSLWRNSKLNDLNFLLQFPNLKKVIISDQSKVDLYPDFKKLNKLEEIYFLYRKTDEIKKYCNPDVKIYSWYNPADIF